MIYKYIGRHQMNRRSYLCLYVYDNSKEFKIGIAGFSIYGTTSEKLRFYLGSSSLNFFSPPKLKMLPRALEICIGRYETYIHQDHPSFGVYHIFHQSLFFFLQIFVLVPFLVLLLLFSSIITKEPNKNNKIK